MFKYDCVIIPNLGGLITNYAPATIHPTQHTFNAPAKKIVFNAQLKNNDGLLANHLAEKEGLTYAQALENISQWVEELMVQLKKGKKVELTYIGTLFFDVEKNLQFTADSSANFLLDSFGLSEFRSNAIKRSSYTHTVTEKVLVEAAEGKSYRKYWLMAAGVPIALALYWIPLNTNLLNSYTSLSPFGRKAAAVYTPSASVSVLSAAAFPSDNVFVPARPETSTETFADASEKAIINQVPVIEESNKYQIVAGCFMSEENALNFLSQLKQRGFTATINGKTKNGLHKVCYNTYDNRNEALKSLASIQQNDPKAWLLSE